MKITVVREVLSDGSEVFNVKLRQEENLILLLARNEQEARMVAAEIRDAVNWCLDEPIEFDFK